jgi:DNA-binding response OmpR family regulator
MKQNEEITILIVDDSPSIAGFTQKILEENNYNVVLASSGEEALEIISKNEFDIILLDIVMPGIGGFLTCKKLKENSKTKHIPVIFLSSLDKSEDKIKAFSYGGTDYIPKPVNPKELLVRINTHLSNSFMQNELKRINDSLENRVKHRTSELQESNNKLSIAKQKAEEAHELKSSFLQNLSHEIRTPLNGIMGFSQLLKIKDLADDVKNSYVDTIYQSSEKLLYIINNIIDLSKIETKQIEIQKGETSLSEIANEIYYSFKSFAANKKLSFEMTSDENNTKIITDKEKTVLILSHLIDNAIKFTAEGRISFGFKLNSKAFEFYVEDTGIGIDEDKMDRVFATFSQEENSMARSYEGLGLGLSISKQYVELMGGKIGVDSEKSKGSKFWFSIPYIQSLNEETSNKDLNILDFADYRNKSILIVEDDLINFYYLKELLSEMNAIIIHAKDGYEAIDFCNNKRIDIVLMDIQMPGMNGIDATREIRKSNSKIPIIAVSAYVDQENIDKMLEVGGNSFVEKPIDREILFQKISELII